MAEPEYVELSEEESQDLATILLTFKAAFIDLDRRVEALEKRLPVLHVPKGR
jgi:hypothetical protein